MEEIKIRNLNWGDKEMMAGIINEIAETPEFCRIKELVVAQATKDKEDEGDLEEKAKEQSKTMAELATNIFSIARERCLPQLKPWMLSLTGLSEEEFNKTMPFDVDVIILNQVLEQKGFSGFFSGASLLFNKIKESARHYLLKLQK